MSMVCGLDLHRGQITFDTVETESGVEWRGRLWRPDRARFRRWLHDELGSRADHGRLLRAAGCAKQGTDSAECANVDIVSFTGPF